MLSRIRGTSGHLDIAVLKYRTGFFTILWSYPPPKREQNSSSYCSCGFSAVFTAGSCIYIFVGRTLTNLEQVVQIWPFLSLVHCSLLCTHHTCASEEAATTICLVFSLGGCGMLLIDLCIILAKTLFVLLLTGRPWWPQFG